MYLVISLLVLRAGQGIGLFHFLIIAYLFTSIQTAIKNVAVLVTRKSKLKFSPKLNLIQSLREYSMSQRDLKNKLSEEPEHRKNRIRSCHEHSEQCSESAV